MKFNVKDIVYLVSLLAVISLFVNDCSNKSLIEERKVSISDTTWITEERDTVIYNYIEKDSIIYKPEIRQVSAPIADDKDSLRNYFAVTDIGVGKISWTANVLGFLEDIAFNSRLEIPERTVYRDHIGTVTKTVEITKIPKWNLYVGAQGIVSGTYADIGPQIQLRVGKVNYSYSYGLINSTHSAAIGLKIF